LDALREYITANPAQWENDENRPSPWGRCLLRPDLTWLPYNMKGACNAPLHGGNYYERVIGDEQELDALREYITANPAQWENDENHLSPWGRCLLRPDLTELPYNIKGAASGAPTWWKLLRTGHSRRTGIGCLAGIYYRQSCPMGK
jgi:hypothetical protein